MSITQRPDTPPPGDERRAAIPTTYAIIVVVGTFGLLTLTVLTQGHRLSRLKIGPASLSFHSA